MCVLKKPRKNGENVDRDWLVWSEKEESLFCFPCRLFSSISSSCKSILASEKGWKKEHSWRKLYNKLPDHEVSQNHKQCYLQWRELERRFLTETDINSHLEKNYAAKVKYWRDLFKRLLAVTLFLGERGLAFRGSTNNIGDSSNGNFLGIIELIAKFDPILERHVEKVRQSQASGTRLQAHYLSSDSQNEFIQACSAMVLKEILSERQKSGYYSILVDATPDSSHTEQNTFIIRYVSDCNTKFEVKERFLAFADCNKKNR